VQRAYSAEAEKLSSDAGPPRRHVSEAQMAAVKLKAEKEREHPPSARVDAEAAEDVFAFIPEPSIRSQQLINAEPLEAMNQAPPWKPGDRVMGVTLGSVLGEGNAGTVWRAEDDDGQPFAVKLFSNRQAIVGLSLSAYQRGVSVMNRLTGLGDQAAGVVPLHAVSLNQLGVVMAIADNGSALDLPALGWPVKQIVPFVEEVARILGRAHAAGALHRCLKPSNILLDGDLRPMISDFDMVDLPTVASTKRDGGGYAAFAAPEELLGQGTQSPTADIYSLGCLLRFLLLGEIPDKIDEDVPALEDLQGKPEGLVRIIRKCCLRAPERRYPTTEELLADLVSYADADEVGVGAGPEADFKPYHVSTLSHDTPWLGGSEGAPPRKPPAKKPAAARPQARRSRPGSKPQVDADAAIGMSRGAEKAVGTLGTFVLLGSILAVVAIDEPSEQLVNRMRYASTLGGGLASFLLSRASSNPLLWRLVALIVLGAAFFFLNLPALLL
jgi:hypothetical protein